MAVQDVRRLLGWGSGRGGVCLIFLLSLPVHADEDPICIREENGTITVTDGECPDITLNREKREGSGHSTRAARPDKTGTPAKKVTGKVETERRDGSSGGDRPTGPIAALLTQIALGADEKESLRQFQALVARGSAVGGDLAEILHHQKGDPRVRWVAARALGQIPGSASSEALLEAVKDPVAMVRVAAIRGLHDLRDPRSREVMHEALEDGAALVRSAALDVLGTTGDRRDAPAVAGELIAKHNFIKKQGLFVRAHAATALGKIGGPVAVDALIRVSEDPDPATRDATKAALLKLSGRTSVPSGPGGDRARWTAWWEQNAFRAH